MPKISELISFEGTLSNSDVFPVVNSSVTKKMPMSALRANVLTSGSLSSSMLQVDSVTTTKIANGNVTEAKLADGSVTNAKIANASVNNNKVADLTITGGKLVNGTITDAQLAAGSVTVDKIVDLNVTTNKIANGAITVAKLDPNAVFPPGTRVLFQQTSAPTGWTKITDYNDRTLRVVNGTASVGGSSGFSSVFASRTPSGSVSISGVTGSVSVTGSVGGTTLTLAQIPSHTHTQKHGNGLRSAGGDDGNRSGLGSNAGVETFPAGGGEAHNHSWTQTSGSFSGSASGSFSGSAMDFAVAYVDIIIAQKN